MSVDQEYRAASESSGRRDGVLEWDVLAPVLLAVVAQVDPAAEAGAGRVPPPAPFVRVPADVLDAVVGCWQLWPGERLTLRRGPGATVEYRSAFDAALIRKKFAARGSNRMGLTWERATYRPDDRSLQVGCGPTTQHGQDCLLRPSGAGLEVALYSRSYKGQSHLRETTRAARCGPGSATVTLPTTSEPGAETPDADRAAARRTLADAVKATKGCPPDGRACWCRRICAAAFRATGAALTFRSPLPGTLSGSTADGNLVPLGPTFDITVDARGRARSCGVTGDVRPCARWRGR
jgi:hypothetical protein